MNPYLPIYPSPSLLPGNHKFVFYTCVSIFVLYIGSFIPHPLFLVSTYRWYHMTFFFVWPTSINMTISLSMCISHSSLLQIVEFTIGNLRRDKCIKRYYITYYTSTKLIPMMLGPHLHQYFGENKYQKWPVLFSWTVYYYIYQETQCTEWKKNLQDVQFHIKIYVSEYYLQNPRYCLNPRWRMAMKVSFLFSILGKVKTQCRKLKT